MRTGIHVRLPGPRIVTAAVFCLLSISIRADCRQQLQRLSSDLRGVTLTETNKQTIGGLVDDARRFCWVQREEPAMALIVKARRIAGIKQMSEEFDWETVPLESLERR